MKLSISVALATVASAVSLDIKNAPQLSLDGASISNSYIVEFKEKTDNFIDVLGQLGVSAVETYSYDSDVFTGSSFHVNNADRQTLATISTLPQVSNVWPVAIIPKGEELVSMANDAAWNPHHITGVDKVKKSGNNGEGVTVAIIDTGVDYTHPALGGNFGPGNKVEGGYDFVGDNWVPGSTAQPDSDPMDCQGRGTHVAGVIAGEDNKFVGVSPAAKLRAYKVFGCASDSTSSDVIMAALEKAYKDGANVITASFGVSNSFDSYPWALMASRMVQKGTFVSLNAGSFGDSAEAETLTAVGSISSEFNLMWSASAKSSSGSEIKFSYSREEDSSSLPAGSFEIAVINDESCLGAPTEDSKLSFMFGQGEKVFDFLSGGFLHKEKSADVDAIYNIACHDLSFTSTGHSAVTDKSFAKWISHEAESNDKIILNFPQDPSHTLVKAASSVSAQGTVFAPGRSIFSSALDGKYAVSTGAGSASSYVAGIAALYISANPGFEYAAISSQLKTKLAASAAVLDGIPFVNADNLIQGVEISKPAEVNNVVKSNLIIEEPIVLRPNLKALSEDSTPFVIEKESPRIYYKVNHETQELSFELVKSDFTLAEFSYPVVSGEKVLGPIAAASTLGDNVNFPYTFHPRSSLGYVRFHALADGASIPTGSYKILSRALKVNGNPSNVEDWQLFLSDKFEIVHRKVSDAPAYKVYRRAGSNSSSIVSTASNATVSVPSTVFVPSTISVPSGVSSGAGASSGAASGSGAATGTGAATDTGIASGSGAASGTGTASGSGAATGTGAATDTGIASGSGAASESGAASGTAAASSSIYDPGHSASGVATSSIYDPGHSASGVATSSIYDPGHSVGPASTVVVTGTSTAKYTTTVVTTVCPTCASTPVTYTYTTTVPCPPETTAAPVSYTTTVYTTVCTTGETPVTYTVTTTVPCPPETTAAPVPYTTTVYTTVCTTGETPVTYTITTTVPCPEETTVAPVVPTTEAPVSYTTTTYTSICTTGETPVTYTVTTTVPCPPETPTVGPTAVPTTEAPVSYTTTTYTSVCTTGETPVTYTVTTTVPCPPETSPAGPTVAPTKGPTVGPVPESSAVATTIYSTIEVTSVCHECAETPVTITTHIVESTIIVPVPTKAGVSTLTTLAPVPTKGPGEGTGTSLPQVNSGSKGIVSLAAGLAAVMLSLLL